MKAAAPKKIAGKWMVRLDQGVEGEAGEEVVVTSATGKQWLAELDELYRDTAVGQYWLTNKAADDEAPAGAPHPTDPVIEPKWEGIPTKIVKKDAEGRVIDETWGVGISMAQTSGKGPDGVDLKLAKGDIVHVSTKSGKEWYCFLLGGKADHKYKTWKCRTERV